MNTKVFNEDKLKENEMDEVVTRVKTFIINDNGEILTAFSGGGVQLIGGHVEEGEQMNQTIEREVLEETGIHLGSQDISEPFFKVVYYTKNYKNTSKNRLSNVWYYFVKTDQNPNLNEVHLTEHEIERGFQLKWVAMKDFTEYVKQFLDDKKEISRNVANEILLAFEEYQKLNQ